MSRIQKTFAELKKRGEAALVPFITAGDPDLATTLKIMRALDQAGADCIVTGCTMCHANLDTRQAGLTAQEGKNEIPVFYFTELMGVAMGHKEVKKWLARHITGPIKLLSNKGLM